MHHFAHQTTKDCEYGYESSLHLVAKEIKKEMEISLQAGELVGVLYDALLKQYTDSNNRVTLQNPNKLCVRLVFCLYAEDAGIFNETIVDLILRKASEDFDWSDISPTIFGAVFESTLNPETRRSGGDALYLH